MPILSLEASTSAVKAMLYDTEQGILGVESIPNDAETADGTTFNPDGVARALLACGAALLGRFRSVKVEAIGLSSIWHSLIVLDGDNRPLGRGLTWADTSSAPTTARYRADSALASLIYQATGCPVHSSYNAWKWMHLMQTSDVSAVRYISCLPEYLTLKLTGERVISRSVAAGSAFLSVQKPDWDETMLELGGINRGMLGRIVEPHYAGSLTSAAAQLLGLPTGTPVAVAGPDGALNHIAAGGLRPDIMTLSIGTSGALRMAHAGAVIPQKQSTWCYYIAEGFHLVGAATSGAGNCVNWFTRTLFGGALTYLQLEAAAVAANIDSVPYFLPFLFGERCPGWLDNRQGGFCGLTQAAGAGEMYRSVLEGVLFNLYQNYLILVNNIGISPSVISISGGITQSPFWMSLAADTFGTALDENTGEHASLLGAAFMALRAIGKVVSLTDIPMQPGTRHLPDMSRHKLILNRFEKWLEYY